MAKSEQCTSEEMGNFLVDIKKLSYKNYEDIKLDLFMLNKVINKYNTKANNLRAEMKKAILRKDNEKIKVNLKKEKKLLEGANNELLTLNIKSSKIQEIRTQIYTGNSNAIRLNDLYNKKINPKMKN